MKTTQFLVCVCLASALATSPAYSTPITIGSVQRTGTLNSATAGATYIGGNLDASVVNAAFSGMAPWTEVGHLDSGAGLSQGLLTITLGSGQNWNDNNVNGTWTIASSFWTSYANAVIGWHVGQGSGDPDVFMFLITQGATSGTWSYDRLTGGGGGFSNMQLFGSGTPRNPNVSIPDGGTTVLMLGAALSGLGMMVRRFRK